MQQASPADLPLAGIKVLDLSAYIAGPYGCALLGDMGADVIKVEPPEGDNLRKYPSTLASESRAFLGINRNKRGLCLNLKEAAGHEILLRLVREADVLVHNFRPGVPERLRIDFATLSAVNPRLVYCAMTGYGAVGPMARHAGYDQVLQSMTGMCAAQAKADGPPEVLYGSVVDYYGAALISNSVAAALYRREKTGRGQAIEVSLLGSALAMQSARLVWADGEPRHIERDMRSGGITGIHPTRDGYLYLSANTPHFWRALCGHLDLPELAEHPDYDSVKKRAAQAAVLVPRVRQALARASAREWAERFGQSVPCAEVRPVEDMFDHPQVEAMGLMRPYHNPQAGDYLGLAQWAHFGGAAPAPADESGEGRGESGAGRGESEAARNESEAGRGESRAGRGAPGLGEHSEKILSTLGYTASEIAQLRQSSVVQ
ncbi:CaiB/BaiF CoA transferase family protein [Achromobacter ruhlandii]|uniref:CaiB/BaiF CoA transferase family protein n=1 Tax=Achromobacter ruhlandii TaxID=72557 RepID=UPI001467078D|nr:CoA transferase [Achromobacter ruhlandii]CAB3664254.1 Formyl-CoA:oxalate CoA-transferase [Achromobacter ruhlandii]